MSRSKDWSATTLPGGGPAIRLPPDWRVETLPTGDWQAADPAGRATARIELRRIAVLPDYDREKVLRQVLAGIDTTLRREILLEPPSYDRAESRRPGVVVTARYHAGRGPRRELVHRWVALHGERATLVMLDLMLTLRHAANDQPDVATLTDGMADMIRNWRP